MAWNEPGGGGKDRPAGARHGGPGGRLAYRRDCGRQLSRRGHGEVCDRRALGVADHGGMVWDEIVAFALVLLFTPAGWLWMALAFALFRLFDILKPWPIRVADRHLKNGFGVMFDDLLAAAFAIAVLKGLQWLV